MKIILAIVYISVIGVSIAQDPNFEWVSGAYGTGNFDFGNSIITDGSGNSYITGQFESTVDFDPGPGTISLTSAGSQDIFISKYNNLGALTWVKTIGNTGSDKGTSIEIDNNGNVLITGTFSGTVDFDPGIGINTMTAVSVDAFILKLNSTGDFIWAKQFAGTSSTNPKTIKIDGNSNIYVIGAFASTTDFDPGVGTFNLTSLGGNDAFCAKLTSSGDLTWAVAFGGTGTDLAVGLSIDASSNVYLTGNYELTVDFDPGAGTANRTSQGSSDIFIQKLNSSGSLLWIKSVGGTGMELAGSNSLNSSNNVLLTGSFQNTVDFDPNAGVLSLTTIGFSAGFILNLSTDGNLNWVKQNEGNSPGISVSCYSLTLDAFDRIYVTGSFDGSVDFDPGVSTFLLSQASGTAGFIQKLGSNGDFVWAGKLAPSTPSITEGYAIHTSLNGKIHVTGAFRVVTDFDPGIPVNSLTSAGGYDIYNLRLNQCEYEINHTTTTLPNFLSECSVASVTPPTASNCMGTYTGVPDISFPITNSGTTVITWTYTNSLGFTSTQTQNVIIDDVTAPVPNIASLTNVNAECSVTNLTAPTATDNCVGTITGTHNATLPISTQGTTVVTWTYNDGNGNTSTQTQNVVIDDVTAPVPNIASLSTVNAQCSVTTLTAPTATDNCSGTITGTHNATLPITTQGTTIVTWTYNDGNGNTSTQTQNVIIDDVTDPVPNNASLASVNAECSVTSLTAPTATDNCSGTITGTHNVSLPITSQGTTVVTWTYNVGNGNTSTQTQNVIIDDVTAPTPNIASLSTVNAECSVTSLTAPTATDNCSGTITGTHNASLPITTQGTTVVTWTYDDGNGNTSSQTQTVVINDVTGPIVDITNLPTIIDTCSLSTLTAPTATDNCSGTITGTHNATLPITSSTVVTWTYDDGNGNITTQDQNVSINQVNAFLIHVNDITFMSDMSGCTYQWIDCNNGNQPIPGETAQTFVATQNGSYAVINSYENCSDTSDCVNVNTIGIDEISKTSLLVYPNPTKDYIVISSETTFSKVELINSLGQKIAEYETPEVSIFTFNIDQERGVYFVKVFFTDFTLIKSVLKN